VKCRICAKRLTTAQVTVAASRGKVASYCSIKCRNTAAKRRQRAKVAPCALCIDTAKAEAEIVFRDLGEVLNAQRMAAELCKHGTV
jgi:hypothetical protein